MPCFEGLFPQPCEKAILDLLFILATWHSLAKLRLHTSSSLSFFESCTKDLGRVIRYFHDRVCPKYKTHETPKEVAAKSRRSAARTAKRSNGEGGPATVKQSSEQKFSLKTYKLHALGHYPAMIRRFGTTDSYSTQTVQYSCSSRLYYLTWFNRESLSIVVSSSFILERTRRTLNAKYQDSSDALQNFVVSRNDFRAQIRVFCSLKAKKSYLAQTLRNVTISQNLESSLLISRSGWQKTREIGLLRCIYSRLMFLRHAESILQDFFPVLKDHLLGRMVETPESGFTDQDRRKVLLHGNRIYCHKTLRINFTIYDCRRDEDTINPRTHSDVMVLADKDEDAENTHPYWYARVIGIFHAMVRHLGSESYEKMDFLWVRWYGRDARARSGFKARRLHRIGFLDSHKDKGAFGFIDPSDVIRAIHLIPTFELGKCTQFLPPSIARREDEGDEDYVRYYVAMYVLFPDHYVLVLTVSTGLSIVTCLPAFVDLAQVTCLHEV